MVDFIDYYKCLQCGKLELLDERDDPPGPSPDCPKEQPYPPCQWAAILVPVPD